MEEIHINKTDQRSRTNYLGKYVGQSLYDEGMNKRYTIDHENIHFVNKYGYALIGNYDEPDGTSTNQEYFSIHFCLFVRFTARNHNEYVSLKIIH